MQALAKLPIIRTLDACHSMQWTNKPGMPYSLVYKWLCTGSEILQLDTLIEEVDVTLVSFANDVLSELDQRTISTQPAFIGQVDLTKVVGTTHPDYMNRTWGALKPVRGSLFGDICNTGVSYQPLKRAVRNVQLLKENPDYYFSKEKKETWSFYKIDDEFYISEGNNRTVVARYFLSLNEMPQIVHGVSISIASRKSTSSAKPIQLNYWQRFVEFFRHDE